MTLETPLALWLSLLVLPVVWRARNWPALLLRVATLATLVGALAGVSVVREDVDVVVARLDPDSPLEAPLPDGVRVEDVTWPGAPHAPVEAKVAFAHARLSRATDRHILVSGAAGQPTRQALVTDAHVHIDQQPKAPPSPDIDLAVEGRWATVSCAPDCQGSAWRLLLNDEPLEEGTMGQEAVRVGLPRLAPGWNRLEAGVGEARAVLQLEGPAVSEVIVVEQPGSPWAATLRRAGVAAVQRTSFPQHLPPLGTVVLANPNLRAWPEDRGETVRAWIHDQGGNLVVFGGSHGLLGDQEHLDPLKRALPVDLPREQSEQPAPLGLVFVVDRSDSMRRADKLAMAKLALIQSVEALHPATQVGLLAFSDFHDWIVEPHELGKGEQLIPLVRGLEVVGGTDIYPALRTAGRRLTQVQAAARHIVLLTDGQGISRLPQNTGIVQRLRNDGITVSTIALSAEADAGELAALSQMGGGRFYEALDPRRLPQLMLEETLAIQDDNVVEEEQPAVHRVGPSRLLREDATDFPPLDAYNRVRARPTADVALVRGAQLDPVLASWRYGRGSATVLATAPGGEWASAWEGWSGRNAFLRHLLDEVKRRPGEGRLALNAWPQTGGPRVAVEVRGPLGRPDGSVQPMLTSVRDGEVRTHALTAQGPGRWVAKLADNAPLRIEATLPTGQTTHVDVQVFPAWPEALGPQPARLQRLADATGGSVDPDWDVLLQSPETVERTQPLRPWLLWLAVALLLADVGLRTLRHSARVPQSEQT